MEQELADFFNRYADLTNAAITGKAVDAGEFANKFASFIVESSPVGVMGGGNDENFRAKIPSGFNFYRKIGISSMTILSKEVTIIDDLHAMVKITWASGYRNKTQEQSSINFDVFYLVTMKNGPKIFAYVTGDEQASLQKHGLI